MRTFAFFILTVFSFQILDVPPLGVYRPKTCCGRAICACQHAKGALCTFRFSGRDDPAPTRNAGAGGMHAHCHLAQNTKAAGAASPQTVKAAPAKKMPGMRLLTQAPCHTNSPKTTLLGSARDFEAGAKTLVSPDLRVQFLPVALRNAPLRKASRRIDRPPCVPTFF